MIDLWEEYAKADFYVFPLHKYSGGQFDKDGYMVCGCGSPKCEQAGKHPCQKGWQHPKELTPDTIDMIEDGDGFGVLVKNVEVIDIDPRNGGDLSYKKLCRDTQCDFEALSPFVVNTGGGGKHIYFANLGGRKFRTLLHDYPGIEFKSSGYVVGAGSIHKTGNEYEISKGHPASVWGTEVPEALQKLLEYQEPNVITHATTGGCTHEEIKRMLEHVSADCNHDHWLAIVMAVHHETDGAGFELIDDWSATAPERYPGRRELMYRWNSLGKSNGHPITIGTLIDAATQNGYMLPVTFEPSNDDIKTMIDTSDIDLLRPPGFVGEVAHWVRQCNDKNTPTIALATALNIVSTAGSLKYKAHHQQDTYGNLFCFCVAGSGVGKGSALKCVREALKSMGFTGAMHPGPFMSEQEIVRAMIRHQPVFYIIDEVGLELTKITKSKADHTQGVTANLMKAFSESDGEYLPHPEVLKKALDDLGTKIAAEKKMISENEGDPNRLAALESTYASLKRHGGLWRPFVSVIGYTTPETFDELVNGPLVTQGFFTRALIFREYETVPDYDENWAGPPKIPSSIERTLQRISSVGRVWNIGDRIENFNERQVVPTTDEGIELLKVIKRENFKRKFRAKSENMQSMYARADELIAKVSHTLSLAEGMRTVEHIKYAFALVMADIASKKNLALANIAKEHRLGEEEVARRVMSLLKPGRDEFEYLSTINAQCKKFKADQVSHAVDKLEEHGFIKIDRVMKKSGKEIKKLYKIKDL